MARKWTWFQRAQVGIPILCMTASVLVTARAIVCAKRDEHRAKERKLVEEEEARRRAEDPGSAEACLHVDPLNFGFQAQEGEARPTVTREVIQETIKAQRAIIAAHKN